jgi:hypothetical protein
MKRAWGLAAVLALALIVPACGTRYERARCDGSPFPEPSRLLSLGSLRPLQYFQGLPPNARRPVDVEIWSNGKFKYTAALQYEFGAPAARSTCPTTVRLILARPLSEERRNMATEFLAALGREAAVDVDDVRAEILVRDSEPSPPSWSAQKGPFRAELVPLQTATRGDVWAISFVHSGARAHASSAAAEHERQ